MGKVIKVNPCNIQPSQDFLKEDTFQFIKASYEKGELDNLPPTPIVIKDEKGAYVAVDGHNLLAFCCLMNSECEVYVAENKNDKMPGDSEMTRERNKDLEEKYNLTLSSQNEVKKKGINSIKDLCDSSRLT
jgi:hypothetical protein